MAVLEQWTEEDGYDILELGGVIHRLQIFTTEVKGRKSQHPLMVEISGMSDATALLDQADIDALHAFLGRYVSPQEES